MAASNIHNFRIALMDRLRQSFRELPLIELSRFLAPERLNHGKAITHPGINVKRYY